jgi:hypothetical protein
MQQNSFPQLLTHTQVDQFERDGFLLVPSFYDLKRDIAPIQRDIHNIIGMLIQKHGLAIQPPPFHPGTFDCGYQELIAHDRKIGGEVYDAVKQIPAFVRLACSERHDGLMMQLRGTDMPGVAAGGYGIRIDNPNEERFRAGWHQDYPAQLRSLDGLVFWSPLVGITEELGPVQFCLGSHKDGLAPVHSEDAKNPQKTGAYALVLKNEEARIARYQRVAPTVSPGDLVIIDFLNLHASGHNRGRRSRWSMQIRYFNFREASGVRMGWCGSFAAGKNLKDIHPELIVD